MQIVMAFMMLVMIFYASAEGISRGKSYKRSYWIQRQQFMTAQEQPEKTGFTESLNFAEYPSVIRVQTKI